MITANLNSWFSEEGSLEAVQVSGLYGYPHEAESDPSSLSHRGASSLAKTSFDGWFPPFQSTLDCAWEEEEEGWTQGRRTQPFFSLRWKEERRKRRAPWLLFPFFLLAAEPREGEGGHVMERRGIPIFIRSAPKSPPFITSRAPTS